MMTLAEQICRHASQANQQEGGAFGAFIGATYPLTRLVGPWLGQTREIADGVRLSVPAGCRWTTADLPGGRVKISFAEPPSVSAKFGPMAASVLVTDATVQISAAAVVLEIALRAFPDATITIPLR